MACTCVAQLCAAARRSADEDQAPKDPWTLKDHLLGDHSAERESEYVARADAETIEEGGRVLRHPRYGGRHLARRATEARIVEQDQLAAAGESVGERGVPIVECACEVLEEKQRKAGAVSEAAIRIAPAPFHFEKLRRGLDRYVVLR